MTNKPDFRGAVAGERFINDHARHGWQVLTIQPKSTTDTGRWHCISCDYRCLDNVDKIVHCGTARRGKTNIVEELGTPAKHVLAWYSADSGEYEEP